MTRIIINIFLLMRRKKHEKRCLFRKKRISEKDMTKSIINDYYETLSALEDTDDRGYRSNRSSTLPEG